MANDLLDVLLRANLVLAAGIVAVLLLRAPARVWFGARIAYALWLIPPLAALMCLLPPRTEIVTVPAAPAALAPVTHLSAYAPPPVLADPTPIDFSIILIAAWAGGVLLSLIVLGLRQHRFVRALGGLRPRADLGAGVFAAASPAIGPALLGVFRPKIVTPADFDERFSTDEQRIILAHERTHLAHGDPLINAATALLQCLNWFNPLMHLAARALRTDQELACDASVLAAAQSGRRPYAETLLKTQHPQLPAPLGCAWPSPTHKSLKERIAMLKRPLPSFAQRLLGSAALVAVIIIGCGAAWTAQPPMLIVEAAAAENEHYVDLRDQAALNEELEGDFQELDELDQVSEAHEPHNIIDANEIREEIRRDIAEAQRDVREARREMEAAGLSQTEIDNITRDAIASAREGIRLAAIAMRAEADRQERDPGISSDMVEFQARTQQLTASALELAALELDGDVDASARARIEADIEAHAQRIEQLALTMEDFDVDVDVDVDTDVDVRQEQHDRN